MRRTIAELQTTVGAKWTPADIKKRYAAARKERLKILDAFIDGGRGHETPLDYRNKTDALSRRANKNHALLSELHTQAALYVGPGLAADHLLETGKL